MGNTQQYHREVQPIYRGGSSAQILQKSSPQVSVELQLNIFTETQRWLWHMYVKPIWCKITFTHRWWRWKFLLNVKFVYYHFVDWHEWTNFSLITVVFSQVIILRFSSPWYRRFFKVRAIVKWTTIRCRFTLTLQRRKGYLAHLLMLPCVFLVCMNLIVFCLPPERPDRHTLGK